MADEQPNTPSAGAEAAPDGAASEPVSGESQEGSSPGWWARLFNRRPTPEASSEDEERSSTGGPSGKQTLTQEELDRRVQSEVDRREAQRAARERAEARKKLRDNDPWAFAEEDRKAEQAVEQTQGLASFFATIGSQHDRVAIDPLMDLLPVSERERIMRLEGAGTGLEGRKKVVTEAIKTLEKHWKAEGEREAERRLRGNSAFRKQVLAEGRRNVVEPELLPSASGSASSHKISDLLRGYYGQGGAHHNTAG